MSGKTFTIIHPLENYPNKPMRYELEVSEHPELIPILRWSQDRVPDNYCVDGFIELDVLIRLGALAKAIKEHSNMKYVNPPYYCDEVEEWT